MMKNLTSYIISTPNPDRYWVRNDPVFALMNKDSKEISWKGENPMSYYVHFMYLDVTSKKWFYNSVHFEWGKFGWPISNGVKPIEDINGSVEYFVQEHVQWARATDAHTFDCCALTTPSRADVVRDAYKAYGMRIKEIDL